MKYLYIFSVLFFLVIINYVYNYYNYHYKENKDFTLFKRLNIPDFDLAPCRREASDFQCSVDVVQEYGGQW